MERTRRLQEHNHRRERQVLQALAGLLYAHVRLVEVRAKLRRRRLKERMECDTAINAWVVALESPSRKSAYTARLKNLINAKALTHLHHAVELLYRAGEPNL